MLVRKKWNASKISPEREQSFTCLAGKKIALQTYIRKGKRINFQMHVKKESYHDFFKAFMLHEKVQVQEVGACRHEKLSEGSSRATWADAGGKAGARRRRLLRRKGIDQLLTQK